MLTQLESKEYGRILPLLQNYQGQSLYAQGVLNGKYEGHIFVDDAENPQSILLLKDGWGNLIGNPHNEAFNRALGDGLANKTIIDENRAVVFIVDPTDAWLKVLQTLVPDRLPIEGPRKIYMARQACDSPILADDFELCLIDDGLAQQIDGDLPGDVQKVLDLRKNTAVPDDIAFGFVVKNGRSCVAWAVVDFIVGTKGEIRLVTEEAYRRQGFATAVSAMAINYGLGNGLKEISWNVSEKNSGSIRTAEKLGLTLDDASMEYILIFPEVGYLINLGFSYLENGRYPQTHQVAAKMLASKESVLKQYGYFLSGAAWAGSRDVRQAFEHLNKAVDAGFYEESEFNGCLQLHLLKRLPDWQSLMDKIKANVSK